jgi:hypothetical protein
VAIAALQITGLNAQMPGGRPPGGGTPDGGAPKGRPTEAIRCPPPTAGSIPLTDEAINRHYETLKSELRLAGTAEALFDKFVRQIKIFLAEEERKQFGGRSISANGAARLAQQLDEARNRYTALEDIEEHKKRLMAGLNEAQRSQLAARLLPMPTAAPAG